MRELDKVLGDEKVLWEGAPKFWPFILGSSIATIIFGLIWMIFLIPFAVISLFDIIFGSHIFGFGILLLPHFWIGFVLVFGIPIYLMLLYKRTYYAITDKRVIIQKGVIGRDFDMIDFDQITNAEVNVGLFDVLFKQNTGSIRISTAGSFTYSKEGTKITRPYTLCNIVDPYEVFKLFKKVSHDVKTDIEYPNKYRPKTNPGYKTQYKAK